MRFNLRWIFYVMVIAAVCLATYRWYHRLPPKDWGMQSNESVADRQNEYPRYFKMAARHNDDPVFGYFVRFTNEDFYSATGGRVTLAWATDKRVTIENRQVFLDGRLILPRKGKLLVLMREDLKTTQLVELDQQEIDRFMEFAAGDKYFDDWKQLWLDLAEKAGSQE